MSIRVLDIPRLTFPLPSQLHATSIRPGPYNVTADTSSAVAKVLPVQFTKAAIVNPFANRAVDSKGKLAVKCDSPAMEVTGEMGTDTGTFCPLRYTISLVSGATVPGTANSKVMFIASGVVMTVNGPKVVRFMLLRDSPHDPGTKNI